MGEEIRQYYTSRMNMRQLDAAGLYEKLKYFYLYFRDRDYFKEKLGITEDYVAPRAKNKAAMSLNFPLFPLEEWAEEDIAQDNLFEAIEFLYDHVSRPGELYDILGCCGVVCRDYDGYDTLPGQEEFRREMNGILVDYGEGYCLTEAGSIVRKTSSIMDSQKISFSFEFFPPRDQAGAERLFQTIRDLFVLKPSYVSVTYGAGGSTRELTHDLVLRISKETSMTVVSHLTCVGSTQEEILSILTQYHSSGIKNIMALRGDPPAGQHRFQASPGGFSYAAELVTFIKKHFPDSGIGVAGYPEGHPETPNRLKEMDYLKAKVDAGADYICTQLFFDNRDFYDFRERCILAHINIPIIAGLMPITTRQGTLRMAELASGTRFPARLLKSIFHAPNDQEVENVGIDWATNQVSDLIVNGVQGIHFYTLNQSKATLKIYESLGVTDSLQLNR